MNHIFNSSIIIVSSTEMCAHFAPVDFHFIPPESEDRAPDPPGFQIFRREVEVLGSPGDGPRAAEASGNLLRCWSHGPVEIVHETPFFLLLVDLSTSQSVCLPEAKAYETQRIWTSPWDWRCGMCFFNYEKGWILLIQPGKIRLKWYESPPTAVQ